MNLLIEPLIIFLVLFFPGLYYSLINLSWANVQIISFDVNQEMLRIITHNIPALCLIWYFLLKEPIRSELGDVNLQKKDIFQIVKVILGLLLIGFISSSLINLIFPEEFRGFHVSGILSWIIIILSCITSGYVEESYFRVYLLKRLGMSGIPQNTAILSSCVLFAVCHLYQGPVGLLSSFLAGLFLSKIYLKNKSIHGIALGHGIYNLISYTLAHIYAIIQ
jgi:membrane protease YdiL (CAAX protease family)